MTCEGANHGRLPDHALLARVADGDEPALAELYRRHHHAAHRLARGVLHDSALAEDAVQEGFVAVWRCARGYAPDRARGRTWILMLVHRRAVDLLRRDRHHAPAPLDAAAAGLADDATGRSDERARVQQALRSLPSELRDPLVLAYYGGLTQRELAERLGEPLGTVKSRTFRGLLRMRDLLAEEHAG